eukprot:gb/GECG01016440.1/.p1 GENE.gb/GECG01016440.1/~~gb/GECG01016440.1/.p1  ORF type:complete len:230 (+),score=36.48 gb/GECG01016440.1/:1-690(+)
MLQGYGWNFFTIWDAIVMELKACAKKVQRFIPQIEEDPAKMSKQPSLSEQLRSSQIPAQYSTASNPAPENLPEITEEDFAPAPPPASEPRADTAVNLLRAPYEHERGTGLELLAAEMDSEKSRKQMYEPLCECIGSGNEFSESRIRALSLFNRMLRDGYITSSDSVPFSRMKEGINEIIKEKEENVTPSFQYMKREYAELALKVIANARHLVGATAPEDLMKSLESAGK